MEQESVTKPSETPPDLQQLSRDALKTRLIGLTSLANSVGLDLYHEYLRIQIETRKNTISFTPYKSVDECLAGEFMKGEVSGIYTAVTLIQPLIEALEAELTERGPEDDESEN